MKSNRPNVLVVFTDQQRWDTCGCYGNNLNLTPNLDALANQGTLFERGFTCQPLCGPARASLQTGMYAAATGSFRNSKPLAPHLDTLAECFNRAGYETGYIGKWHLADTREKPVPKEMRAGYKYWLAADALEWTSQPTEGIIFDTDNQPVEIDDYRVDWLTHRAIDFIKAPRGNKPFFLFLSLLEPHHQTGVNKYIAPEGYAEKYADCPIPGDLIDCDGDFQESLPDYYGMVARIDECLGKMIDTLKAQGLADDTIILFTSDHGCHFRTRNKEYKRSCHEASIRIPMVACGGPFKNKPIDQLVSLVDLPPTILDACGLDIPNQMQGRSVLPLLSDQNADWPEEVFIQISGSHVGRAIRTDRWKYSARAPNADRVKDCGADYYIDDFLYDLDTDPHEQDNLIGKSGYDEVLNDLRARLKARMVLAGETEPKIDPVAIDGE